MAHVAPVSHHAAHASHRGTGPDGPVLTGTWLGLTFGLIFGLVLVERSHVGIRAAGITLLIMLAPLTLAVFGAGLRRGFGSILAALSTLAALIFVILHLTLLG